MAKVLYLFNSSGEWIAFKLGKNLYNNEAEWIGWFPWDDIIAVSVEGEYLGTIYKNERLLYNMNEPYRGYPRISTDTQDTQDIPGYPGFAGYSPLVAGTKDVPLKFLKEDKDE